MALVEIIGDIDNIAQDIVNSSKMSPDDKIVHNEQSELFYKNIPLFIEKRELILANPRLYSIKAPVTLFEQMYMSTGGGVVTLGELLNIWENEDVFFRKCKKRKKFKQCGGKAVIFRFGGSPLSGRLFEKKSICTKCGHVEEKEKTGSMGALRDARYKYHPIEPVSDNPASVAELVAICKGEKFTADNAESTKLPVVKGAEPVVNYGGKDFTNEQFLGLLAGAYTLPASGKLFVVGDDGKVKQVDKKDKIVIHQPITDYTTLRNTAWRLFDSTVPEEEGFRFGEEEMLLFDKYDAPTGFSLTDDDMTSNIHGFVLSDGLLTFYGEKVVLEILPDGHLKMTETETKEQFEYVYEKVPFEQYSKHLWYNYFNLIPACPVCGNKQQQNRVTHCRKCGKYFCEKCRNDEESTFQCACKASFDDLETFVIE